MKKFHSHYPLGQMLITILAESGLNLPDFLRAIGYRNVDKGIRHFRDFLTQGLGSNVLIQRLLDSAFAPSCAALKLICHQNMQQAELDYCARPGSLLDAGEDDFVPCLHAVPALHEIGPLSRAALAGEMSPYAVELRPSVTRLPADQIAKVIGRLVKKNYQETGGEIECLGPISYYLCYLTYDEPPRAFSIQGEFLGAGDTDFVSPRQLASEQRAFPTDLMSRLLHWRRDLPMH